MSLQEYRTNDYLDAVKRQAASELADELTQIIGYMSDVGIPSITAHFHCDANGSNEVHEVEVDADVKTNQTAWSLVEKATFHAVEAKFPGLTQDRDCSGYVEFSLHDPSVLGPRVRVVTFLPKKNESRDEACVWPGYQHENPSKVAGQSVTLDNKNNTLIKAELQRVMIAFGIEQITVDYNLDDEAPLWSNITSTKGGVTAPNFTGWTAMEPDPRWSAIYCERLVEEFVANSEHEHYAHVGVSELPGYGVITITLSANQTIKVTAKHNRRVIVIGTDEIDL